MPGNGRGLSEGQCLTRQSLFKFKHSSTIAPYSMASTMRPLSRCAMPTARRKTASARLAAINRQFSSTPRAMAFEVKKLGVIGAGQMVRRSSISPGRALLTNLQGLGIALVAAQKAEIPVILVDNAQASLDKGLKF